jgi:hypothetical protein
MHFTLPRCLYKSALYLTTVPVQGCTLPYLGACTMVHFTLPQCLYKGALYLTSVPVQGCTLPYLGACTRVHFTLPQCLYKGALYFTFFVGTSCSSANCHIYIYIYIYKTPCQRSTFARTVQSTGVLGAITTVITSH